MSNDIQTNLCKGIRACGLPKVVSLEILNTVTKWWKCNGEQWTVDRLKAYKQWYETCLAGSPEPPAYFRKTKDGYPTGCFGRLFRVKNQAKVLAVLSAGTVFQADELTSAQRKKFTTALKGDHLQHQVDERDLKKVRNWGFKYLFNRVSRIQFADVVLPTPDDMTGTSIPLVGRKSIRLPSDPYDRVNAATHALMESWRSIPQAVLDYLDRLDHLDWIPENLSDIYFAPRKSVKDNPIGRIGLIQEPQLKLRSVANPNRVAQAFTKPLADFWEATLRVIPTDYTFDQGAGCRWVQDELRQGHVLAGSDLSSATDLLDLDCCLQLAHAWCSVILESREEDAFRYGEAERYFTALSRGQWDTPASSHLGRVCWEQGQPLGLYPSFRLLAITNNVIGMLAARDAHLDIGSSFAVIGDDFICRAEMAEAYNRRIEALGGQINRSKTITSSKVAEFAGRVITPDRVMLKTIKFKLPSDDSFMSVVSDLGPQARNLLGNRQKKAWDTFKYVPGIVYDGPWSQDSFGEPLVERIAWTESTTLVDKVSDPDAQTRSLEQLLIRAVAEESSAGGTTVEEILRDYPWPIDEDIQSSQVSGAGKPSGDPRRVNGQSTLERLEKVKSEPGFLPYLKFKEASSATTSQVKDAETTATPTLANIAADVSARTLASARVQDSGDGDEPETTTTATGGIQQTEEPAKGPSKPTVGSKPAVVAQPTIGCRSETPHWDALSALLASQDAVDDPLEKDQPTNPDMPT